MLGLLVFLLSPSFLPFLHISNAWWPAWAYITPLNINNEANRKPLMFFIRSQSIVVCLLILADPCLRYDCYGGTCTNDRGTARCICPTGRVGSQCQGWSSPRRVKRNNVLYSQMMFVQCIHVQTTANACRKATADVVFALRRTMAMIVAKVKITNRTGAELILEWWFSPTAKSMR